MGVVAVGVIVLSGWGHSQADLNENSETAVCGSVIERRSCVDSALHTDITVPSPGGGDFNGFLTSFATFITVSNLLASSAVGSR